MALAGLFLTLLVMWHLNAISVHTKGPSQLLKDNCTLMSIESVLLALPMRKAVSVFAGLPGSNTPVVTAWAKNYLMVIEKLPFQMSRESAPPWPACRKALSVLASLRAFSGSSASTRPTSALPTNHSIKPCMYGAFMGQGFGNQAAGLSAF